MSLTNTTGADEQVLLAAATQKVKNILGIANVYDRIRSIASMQDFVRKLTARPDGRKEIRYADFEFLGYDDSADEGDDDCPVAILIYRFHFCFQFVDARPDGSNSAREFTAANLALRKDFLETRDVFAPGIVPEKKIGRFETLTRETFAVLGLDAQTGVESHSINYFLKVRHYGN